MLLLPTVGIGSTYFKHEGHIAKTEGNIIKANKDALFVGLGPSVSISFADAIFAPLVARQGNRVTQAGERRVHSETLLAVIEYGQQADGSILTPEPLHAFGAPAQIAGR